MKQSQRIGRRQFLRDSALGLGATPLLADAALTGRAGVQAQNVPASNSNALKMQAKFGSADTVWILREPHAGFPGQLAAVELARGLRNLGFAREPVQAVLGESEPPSSGFVFHLSTNKEGFKHPEAYEISRPSGAGKASRVHLPAPRRRRFSTPCLISWSGRGRSLGWTARSIPWSRAHS